MHTLRTARSCALSRWRSSWGSRSEPYSPGARLDWATNVPRQRPMDGPGTADFRRYAAEAARTADWFGLCPPIGRIVGLDRGCPRSVSEPLQGCGPASERLLAMRYI